MPDGMDLSEPLPTNSVADVTSGAVAPAKLRPGRIYTNTSSSNASTPLQPVRVYVCPPRDRPLYTVQDNLIKIHATDAHESYWQPPELEKWHQPADESVKELHGWKMKAGKLLAKELNLEKSKKEKEWTLADWPEGYRMYVRRHPPNPSDDYPYIAGSTFIGDNRRFRTAREFAKHLAWLCIYGDSPSARCECKHCNIIFADPTNPRGARVVRLLKADSPAISIARQGALQREDRKMVTLQDLPEEDKRGELAVEQGDDDAMDVDSRGSLTPKAVESPLKPAPVQHQPASSGFTFKVPQLSAAVPAALKALFNPPVASSSKITADMQDPASTGSSSKLPAFRPLPSTSAVPKIVEELKKEKGKGRAVEGKAAAPPTSAATQSKAKKPAAARKSQSRVTVNDDKSVSPPVPVLGKRKRKSMDDSMDTDFQDNSRNGDAEKEGEEPAPTGQRRSTRARKQVNYALIPEPPAAPATIPDYAGPFVHKERYDDLAMTHKFPYRLEELVWVALEKPIQDTLHPEVAITHWPGIVKERKLHIEAKVYLPAMAEEEEGDIDRRPEIRSRQTRSYIIMLLGTSNSTVDYKNSRVLPFSAYFPPGALSSDEQKSRLKDYKIDPPMESMKTLEQALTVFAFAQQIATHMRRYYSFFGQMTDPSNKRLKKKKRTVPAKTVKGRLKQIEALERSKQFYQCLWWGAEKIWVGEMVRLNGVWDADAEGNAYVKRPNGKSHRIPGAKLNLENVGRPVLFVLSHLFRDPKKKTLRIMGSFFELVNIESKGKGREKEGGDEVNASDKTKLSKTTVQAYIPTRYLPVPPPGKKFRILEGVTEHEDFEFDASLLAGRYYDYETTNSERHKDDGVRRSIKTLAGKPTKKVAHHVNSTPEHWTVDRADAFDHAGAQARDDMKRFFDAEALRKGREGKFTPVKPSFR